MRSGESKRETLVGKVTFEPVDDEALKDRIDEAYWAKYGGDPYFSARLLERSRHQIAKVSPASRPSDAS